MCPKAPARVLAWRRSRGAALVPDMPDPRPWAHRLGWIALALLGAGNAVRLLPFQVDDAFITYRFARNVLGGHGFVFNPGGPAVEGFTSPGWLAAQVAAAAVAGVDALPLAAAALGLASLVAATALAWSAGGPDLRSRAVAGGLIALLPGVAFYGVAGLEPVAFLAVVLAVAGAAVGALPFAVGAAAAVLAVAVRPEGAWLPVMLGAMFAVTRGDWHKPGALVGLVVVGALGVLAWRWGTFGDMLPNTYYAKKPDRLAGLQYVGALFSSPWAAGLLVCAGLGAWWGETRHRAFLAAGVSWVVAAALEGGDWMPLGRMLVPATGLLALAAGGVAAGPAWRLLPPLVVAGLSLMAFQAQIARSHLSYRTIRHDAVRLVDWLESRGIDSVAMVDIGATGFATDMDIVDLAGLTDPVIARMPGGHMGKDLDVAYVLGERKPAAVVLRMRASDPPQDNGGLRLQATNASSQMEGLLLDDPTLGQGWRLERLFAPGYPRRPHYAQAVFVRRDLPEIPGTTGADRYVLRQPWAGPLTPTAIHAY